jgi:uncharacterized membrane protein
MKPAARLALTFVVALAVGHVGTILVAPRAIMAVAMARLSHNGADINRFRFAPRVDATSRAVVRPSPDLAYGSCVYDLEQGPIRVVAAPTADHAFGSIAVFAANTDTLAAFDTLTHPNGIDFVLALPGQAVPAGAQVVRATTTRGIILDRRLAPDAAAFAAADRARRGDWCGSV